MLAVMLCFLSFALGDVTANGGWVQEVYKAKQHLSLLDSTVEELDNQARHIHNVLDNAKLDFENTIPSAKAEIAAKMRMMEEQLATFDQKRSNVLSAMKEILSNFPEDFKSKIIRELKLDVRFNQVDSLLEKVKMMKAPKKAVTKAVKKALDAVLN
ncbi:hypothetical protein EIN_171910 [Entamoeba invadens IP1]|uniref:Uncharacterized protein n=1 Tax=Entamoeba invadens IP1 TaxID=370355 RepID=A0A0A1TVX4_ENTIV|nr:hypothetical protein EIN_171910 [Entamoeba invadens IP1]ELP84596.1 hypothetical protein EIN_171910 [Entamoeba invadens IP1]|eukprot:XP_004183942.1 hypothetical protein EIN_171910 [Entamoeba invadens IP1]